MSEEKYLRPKIMDPSPKTVASVASDYMVDFPWGEDGVTERPYTSDREFLPVLLDCVGRVFSAQTRVGLKCAIGDVIGAIGVRLIRGTDAYDNSMSTVQQAALYMAGVHADPFPWGRSGSDIARSVSETLHLYTSTYAATVVRGTVEPGSIESRTNKILMDLASKSVYLLALMEDLYPTAWEDDFDVSPLKDEDLDPRPEVEPEGTLEQLADRIFEEWKANHDG